jgi:hypothetical protein
MSSLLATTKQIPANAGYYITVGDCRLKFYANNGTDAAPSFGQMVSTMSSSGLYVSSLVATAGTGIFKDMGKSLVSSGRTFRKVQLMISSGLVSYTGGVGGADVTPSVGFATSYLTGYIELPGQHGITNSEGTFTPVARLG